MMPYTQAMPGNSLNWLWHWLGYTVALVSLGVVVWALFWDRARGRKRCRKCFYDLSGIPKPSTDSPATCPECGKAHTKPKQFLKTRRRLRWAGVGLLAMVVGGYGLWVVPRVQDEGAWGLVPTPVFVLTIDERTALLTGDSWRWDGNESMLAFEIDRRGGTAFDRWILVQNLRVRRLLFPEDLSDCGITAETATAVDLIQLPPELIPTKDWYTYPGVVNRSWMLEDLVRDVDWNGQEIPGHAFANPPPDELPLFRVSDDWVLVLGSKQQVRWIDCLITSVKEGQIFDRDASFALTISSATDSSVEPARLLYEQLDAMFGTDRTWAAIHIGEVLYFWSDDPQIRAVAMRLLSEQLE